MPDVDLTNLPAEIILRKSRMKEETLEEVFKVHRARLIELADHHQLSYNVSQEVVSGADSSRIDRIFGQVMKKTDAGLCRVWVAMDVDRLARPDPEDAGKILKCIQRNRVYILTPDHLYQPDNWDDIMFLKTKLWLADMELTTYRKRAAKTRDHIYRKENRYPGGRAPYGYVYIMGDRPRKIPPRYETDPVTYPHIELIWSLAKRYGQNTILAQLKEKFPECTLTRTNLGYILHNPFYAGYTVFRGHRQGYSRLENEQWVWPDSPGDYVHPISLETWREVQGQMSLRSKDKTKTAADTWAKDVTRFIQCGNKGRGISGENYVCSSFCHIIKRHKVHRIIEYYLWYLFSSKTTVAKVTKLATLAAHQSGEERADLMQRLRIAQEKIKVKQGQVRRLMDAYTLADVSVTVKTAFEAQLEEWSAEMQSLERERESLTERLAVPTISEDTLGAISSVMLHFELLWPALSAPQKREIVRLLFDTIEVDLHGTGPRSYISNVKLTVPGLSVPLPPSSLQGRIGMDVVRLFIELNRSGKTLTRKEYLRVMNCSRPHADALKKKCTEWLAEVL